MREDYAQAYPDLYRRHWWWRSREASLTGEIGRIVSELKKRPRILDVGCGSGLFFDALSTFGDVHGLESDASSVEHSGRWRHQISVGVLDDHFKVDTKFDIVLMLDVLEHVDDPLRLLMQVHRVLAPHGFLLVTVPAYEWLWTSHDVLNMHQRRYTRRSLAATMQSARWAPRRSRYLFHSLVIPKLVVRLMERNRVVEPRVPRIPIAGLNWLATWWYRLENRAFAHLPFGGSLLMVASPNTRMQS